MVVKDTHYTIFKPKYKHLLTVDVRIIPMLRLVKLLLNIYLNPVVLCRGMDLHIYREKDEAAKVKNKGHKNKPCLLVE